MKMRLLFMLGSAALLFLSMMIVPDDGDNGWRGMNRDGKVEGFSVPATWPGMLNQDWQVPVGLGDASPVLADGRIYLHTKKDSSEVALCLEAATGKVIWEQENNPAPEVTGGAASHPGPRSTPLVTGNRVINTGAGGYMTCRDAATGALIWETDRYTAEVPQFFVAVSPLSTGNRIIAHMYGKEKGSIVALDPETGAEIWKVEGIAATYSSPVFMPAYPDMVVVQGETELVGIAAASGEVLWRTPTPGETRFYNSSTPVIDGHSVIIAGQGSGARSLAIGRDEANWSVTETWKNPAIHVSFNTPVLKEGFIYGNDARFGYLFCVNAVTGTTAWIDTVKNNRFAALLDLGSVLVSLPATGQLIVFKPDSEKYSQIVRYKVADTEVYAHPLFSGKNIYVKDKEYLTCWSLPEVPGRN
ncbi:MAG TPA: PQQ-like beta-propeller repeat protein [Prolixibacteraceae bacterium]|nr:PQQ-like beta-propeller repeat protein [Prolixibacteraceae bacterium]